MRMWGLFHIFVKATDPETVNVAELLLLNTKHVLPYDIQCPQGAAWLAKG